MISLSQREKRELEKPATLSENGTKPKRAKTLSVSTSQHRLQQFHNMVNITLNGRQSRQILSLLAAQTVRAACDTVREDAAVFDAIAHQLNAFPHVYASEHAHLNKDCALCWV